MRRSLRVLLVILALLVPVRASAQIAFDAATDGGNNAGASLTLTWSHTCTGSQLALAIGVIGDYTVDDLTSVTVDGSAAAFVGKVQDSAGRWTYGYLYMGPAAGSRSIVVTANALHYVGGLSASYTGVRQTSEPEATPVTNSAVTSAANLTTALTSVTDNSWHILVASASNAALAAGTGATMRKIDAAFSVHGIFDSNGPKTPAGSYSLQTTGNGPHAHVLFTLAPDTGGGAAPGLLLRGIGL